MAPPKSPLYDPKRRHEAKMEHLVSPIDTTEAHGGSNPPETDDPKKQPNWKGYGTRGKGTDDEDD